MTYETITESAAINIFGLLGSIGGTLGLFIGIGALNIIEMIQLLIAILGCSTAEYRSANNNSTKNDSEEAKRNAIQPIDLKDDSK